jgi:hypothetical protein
MNSENLIRELQILSGLYDAVEEQLKHEHQSLEVGDFFRRAELARGDELLTRLCGAEQRLAHLVLEWRTRNAGPRGRGEPGIDRLAGALADRARSLLVLAEQNERLLLRVQNAALDALREIRCGTQFFQNMLSQQEKQPRFIDAHR